MAAPTDATPVLIPNLPEVRGLEGHTISKAAVPSAGGHNDSPPLRSTALAGAGLNEADAGVVLKSTHRLPLVKAEPMRANDPLRTVE